MTTLPHRQMLMQPTLDAVRELGGSASVEELRDRVIQNLCIPDALANEPYVTKRGNRDGRTLLEYELAWARTALRQLGYLDNSARGVWVLTGKGHSIDSVGSLSEGVLLDTAPDDGKDPYDWRTHLAAVLSSINPTGFERLVQRILRETGFAQVEVTGRSGDGGIDGHGVIKINGILSFHVVFQCKRHKAPISAAAIRDFRGAMSGRTDKGLFITTGVFTREAIKEARRQGAVAIDLIDGDMLADKLKSLRLGLKVEQVEQVRVDAAWFDTI